MENFWCGDEAGFEAVQAAKIKADAIMAKGGDGFPQPEPMYNRQGSVGVVSIAGPLVSGEAGFMRLFGITGYDDIRQAVLQGLADKGAKSIMLSINSGGGSVNGTSDTAKFLKSASVLKPITAYAENAASAAYWLASAASYLTAADTAITGSIGVLKVHTEYSKAAAMEGRTTTILRKGEFKALVNPIEPLTPKAIAEVDSQLTDLYNAFIGAVAANRNVKVDVADQKMGQGREFLGMRGVEAGLVDKIGTYEDALAHASALNGGDNRATSATTSVASAAVLDNNTPNPKQGNQVKPTLTEEQIAALALAGAVAGTPEGDALLNKAAEDKAKADAAAALLAGKDIDAVKAELLTATTTITDTQAKLTTAETKLVEAQATITAGEQAAIAAGEQIKQLSAIVSAYTSNMVIALGGKTDGIAAMSAKDLMAKHAEISTTYKATIKAGGLVKTQTAVEQVAKPIDARFRQMVKTLDRVAS